MHNPLAKEFLASSYNLPQHFHTPSLCAWSMLGQSSEIILATFHHDIHGSILLKHLVDLDDVGMVELRQNADLISK